MNIYTPYVYLIGWTQHQKYYYGVKYAHGCHPDGLWQDYFTSSKYVAEFREIHGEPDVIQIRRTFDNAEAAILWEAKVLRRLCAVPHPKMLNANVGGSVLMTEEVKAKIGEKNKGKTRSAEARAKISAGNKGKTMSAETRAKIGEASRNRSRNPHTAEARAKMSIAAKGRPGKPHTAEARAKMSIAAKGRPGKPHTAETRAKISEAGKGRTVSAETRAKMSEAAKK